MKSAIVCIFMITGLLRHGTWSGVRRKWGENTSREEGRRVRHKWPEDVDYKWGRGQLVSSSQDLVSCGADGILYFVLICFCSVLGAGLQVEEQAQRQYMHNEFVLLAVHGYNKIFV
jgi:hypothetical protein